MQVKESNTYKEAFKKTLNKRAVKNDNFNMRSSQTVKPIKGPTQTGPAKYMPVNTSTK